MPDLTQTELIARTQVTIAKLGTLLTATQVAADKLRDQWRTASEAVQKMEQQMAELKAQLVYLQAEKA